MSIWNRIRIWRVRRSSQVDEFEAMFRAREDAVAELAALTNQAVFGPQQAQLQENLSALTAAIASLGERVRASAEAGAALGERIRRIRYENQLRGERTAARRWYLDYITATYAAYGWEWPGPVSRERA